MIDNIFPVLLFRHPDHAGAFLSLLADAQYQQFPVFAPGIYLVLRLAGSAGKKLRVLLDRRFRLRLQNRLRVQAQDRQPHAVLRRVPKRHPRQESPLRFEMT